MELITGKPFHGLSSCLQDIALFGSFSEIVNDVVVQTLLVTSILRCHSKIESDSKAFSLK